MKMLLSLRDKVRLTHDAIRDFARHVPAARYDVRLISQKPAERAIMRTWSIRELFNPDIIRFMRARNAEGRNVFIRPISLAYVLVDLDVDGMAGLRWMLDDGVAVVYAVRTSPGHAQAWVRLGFIREINEQDHKEAARLLATRYGGDPGSAKIGQLGRAPGFFNRKPQYRDAKGRFPLVGRMPAKRSFPTYQLLEEVRQRIASRPPLAPAPLGARCVLSPDEKIGPHEACELFEEARMEIAGQNQGVPIKDRSLVDIKIAHSLRRQGFEPEEVRDIIAAGSPKAHERGPSYVEATVGRAFHDLERQRCIPAKPPVRTT